VAQDLQASLKLLKQGFRDEKNMAQDEQLSQFEGHYYDKHKAEFEPGGVHNAFDKFQTDLENLAQRCATNSQPTESEVETLRMFYDARQDVARLLNDFAPVCGRLATLATKSLHGEALTEEDARWIENYGVTLAGFHFYYGDSYEVPQDDFPIVTRVFSNPLTDSMLYAGVARPQALYVIVPTRNSLQL
jgi:hypothetical protein